MLHMIIQDLKMQIHPKENDCFLCAAHMTYKSYMFHAVREESGDYCVFKYSFTA